MWHIFHIGPKIYPCSIPQEPFLKSESLLSILRNYVCSERLDSNHCIFHFQNLIALGFCSMISWSIKSKAFWSWLKLFQLTNRGQTLLTFYLLKRTNKDLLNDLLESLISNCIIYFNLKEKHFPGHELTFQWF